VVPADLLLEQPFDARELLANANRQKGKFIDNATAQDKKGESSMLTNHVSCRLNNKGSTKVMLQSKCWRP